MWNETVLCLRMLYYVQSNLIGGEEDWQWLSNKRQEQYFVMILYNDYWAHIDNELLYESNRDSVWISSTIDTRWSGVPNFEYFHYMSSQTLKWKSISIESKQMKFG